MKNQKLSPYRRKALSCFLAFLLLLSFALNTAAADMSAVDPSAASGEAQTPVTLTDFERFMEAYKIFKDNHLSGKDGEQILLDTIQKLLEADPELAKEVMYSLTGSEDRYGTFFTAEEYEAYLNQKVYSGIGVAIDFTNNVVTITDVNAGSPAYNAGVKVGDIVYMVAGKKAYGLPLETLQSMIRGESDTTVTMSFYRPSEAKIYTYKLLRQTLSSTTVKYEFRTAEDGTKYAYVRISDFLGIDTYFQFVNFKNDAIQQGVRKVVFDVRDNPGGSLTVCLDLINWCVKDAEKTICSIYGRDKQLIEEYKTNGRAYLFDSIAVLVNKNSASAAELFSISLQENGVAKIIGTNTFGKAVGQTHFALSDNSVVSVTDMEVASPSGKFYNGIGVIPDIEISNDEYKPGVLSFAAFNTKNYAQAKKGVSNDAVNALEQRLVLLGLLDTADKTYDQKTSEAVHKFQYQNGLAITGELDAKTFSLLTDVVNLVKYTKPVEDKQLKAAVEYILGK